MKFNLLILALSLVLLIGSIGGNISEATSTVPQNAKSANAIERISVSPDAIASTVRTLAVVHYRISPAQSQFMANVGSGGPLWFMGHTHHFAIRDFTGEATISPGSLAPASLEMTVKAASLEETGENFTEQQKQTINNMARKQVLEVGEYPEIVFKSTNITGTMKPDGHYEAKIDGDLTLHGVTRPIEIPAQVTVNGNTLHANGEFSVNRSDYKVKTHSIKWGTIRVRNKIRFEFDIVANKV
jgi:polyisoprenoid-binding protein YceI